MSGLIHSTVAGRTDRLPMAAPVDAYIVPADAVSTLGQGNSLAGAAILDKLFGTAHQRPDYDRGGKVDIIAAGGEYVVPPEVVRKLGNGDMTAGHKRLDGMVANLRKHAIKNIKRLPKPKS